MPNAIALSAAGRMGVGCQVTVLQGGEPVIAGTRTPVRSVIGYDNIYNGDLTEIQALFDERAGDIVHRPSRSLGQLGQPTRQLANQSAVGNRDGQRPIGFGESNAKAD